MPVISQKIHKAALKFLVPSNNKESCAIIMREAISLTSAKYGAILVENNGRLETICFSQPKIPLWLAECRDITMAVFKTNRAKLVTKKIRLGDRLNNSLPEASKMIFPLAYGKKCIGVIVLWSKPNIAFSKDDLQVLQYFAPLATLAIQNSKLIDKTQKALDSRELFLSMASHELKTPLTSISIFTQLMQRRLLKGEPIELDWINTVANETLRLSKLANELLQVNRIALGKLHYAWKYCSLNDIIKRTITTFLLSWPEKTISVTNQLSKDDSIWADYDKLIQVLVNLLTNAAKFSMADDPIGLSLERKDNIITIVVSDKGIGIAKKDLPFIFEGFYRGGNSQHEGMGLGLYLTKQIVDAHKGIITVKSKKKEGTDVSIILPAKRPS